MPWIDVSTLNLSDHQRSQLAINAESPISILSGGPGCGKSHCVAEILSKFKGDACVVAPTGKAAARIRELNPSVSASTIHSALQPTRGGRDGEGWAFARNKSCPLDYDLIVIEESSMLSASLMFDFMCAIRKGTILMFVGDPFQLAPVGAGKPFRDMIDSGVPHGQLTELWRFAGRIARVCDDIKHGRSWTPSPKLNLEKTASEFGAENLIHIESSCLRIPINLRSFVEQFQSQGYVMDQIQVLSPCKESGDLSCARLNSLMMNWFNPDGEPIQDPNAKSVSTTNGGGKVFRVGDKIILKKNSLLNREPRDGETQEEAGKLIASNGDTGIILGVLTIRNRIYVRCKMPAGIALVELSDFRHDFWQGYVLTYHSTQGSQWPVVIPIIDDSNGARMVCDRSLHYTGDSRPSEICCLVGPRAVHNGHCRTVRLNSRVTFLSQEIKRPGTARMAGAR